MKTYLITLVFVLISILNYAQVNTSASYTGFVRKTPKVGFMLNYLTKPSWSNQSFIDSVKKLGLDIIRYPGGTESQYFDWQTGKSVPSSLWTSSQLFSHSYIGTVPHLSYPLTELNYFYQQTGIKPIFCLNLLTKSLANQIQMLQSAQSLGIPIEYIELGNELYFTDTDFTNKYPNPNDYVTDIKNNWLPQLQAAFPLSKIAVIGSYDGVTDLNGNTVPTRISSWNNSVYTQSLTANAITFHYYLPPNTTNLSSPNISQALAAPFKHFQTLKINTLDNLLNGMDVWITEYNLNDGNQTSYAIASSWTHGLYTAAIFSQMLDETKIKMMLNHQLCGSATYASLSGYTLYGDTITNKLTAEGNAMMMLHNLAIGSDSVKKIQFSVNPTITESSVTYPSLIGWEFFSGNVKENYFLNLASQSFAVNTSNIINTNFEFEQIYASNPLTKNITTQNLIKQSGTTSNNINLPAYSLTSISNKSIVTSVNYYKTDYDLDVFPNPTDQFLNISYKYIGSRNDMCLRLFNTIGEEMTIKVVKSENENLILDLSMLESGIYFLKLKSSTGNVISVKKIIIN